jgi:hypothetical protein
MYYMYYIMYQYFFKFEYNVFAWDWTRAPPNKMWLFLGLNGTRFARAISGPKKSRFSVPTPSNAPHNDVAPLKTKIYVSWPSPFRLSSGSEIINLKFPSADQAVVIFPLRQNTLVLYKYTFPHSFFLSFPALCIFADAILFISFFLMATCSVNWPLLCDFCPLFWLLRGPFEPKVLPQTGR